MNLGQGLPVHLPSEEDLVYAYFAPGHGHHIVEDFALFKVRIGSCKLNVLGAAFEPTAELDDFFQADTGPTGSANRAFAPLPNTGYFHCLLY